MAPVMGPELMGYSCKKCGKCYSCAVSFMAPDACLCGHKEFGRIEIESAPDLEIRHAMEMTARALFEKGGDPRKSKDPDAIQRWGEQFGEGWRAAIDAKYALDQIAKSPGSS